MDVPAPSFEEPLPWERIIARSTHDMKTPLSSIRVTLEVLRMTCAGSEAHLTLLAMIDSQVNDLARQVDTLATDPAAVIAR